MAGRVVLKEDNSPSRRIARAGGKVKDAKVEVNKKKKERWSKGCW